MTIDNSTLEMAANSIVRCVADFKLCVRISPDGTFKPEGEAKMTLTEFLAWTRNRLGEAMADEYIEAETLHMAGHQSTLDDPQS